MTLADCFSGCLVINLPERKDRLQDMQRELATVGVPADWAEFFPAVRPADLGGFPSIGARGCFLSHLGVLKSARDRRWANVLILEDDLTFNPNLSDTLPKVAEALGKDDWDFAYLGHILSLDSFTGPISTYAGPIATTHFVAINGRCFPALIKFLETVLSRPPGHPDGGPMHVDGAYSTFRAQNPDIVTLVAHPSLGGQRASRSDVSPGWKDTIPGLRSLMSIARKVRNRITNGRRS